MSKSKTTTITMSRTCMGTWEESVEYEVDMSLDEIRAKAAKEMELDLDDVSDDDIAVYIADYCLEARLVSVESEDHEITDDFGWERIELFEDGEKE